MTKLPKIFLVISLTAFLAVFTEAGSSIGWGILKPLSAIFFILFFITNLVAKEMEKFEEEQRLRMTLAEQNSIAPTPKRAKHVSQQHRPEPVLATTASQH
jgi:hypothetical protein